MVTFVEASWIIENRYGYDGLRDLDLFVATAGIELVPVDGIRRARRSANMAKDTIRRISIVETASPTLWQSRPSNPSIYRRRLCPDRRDTGSCHITCRFTVLLDCNHYAIAQAILEIRSRSLNLDWLMGRRKEESKLLAGLKTLVREPGMASGGLFILQLSPCLASGHLSCCVQRAHRPILEIQPSPRPLPVSNRGGADAQQLC